MKIRIIQTLFIRPSAKPYQHPCGWLTPEHHLIAWSFSCLQLHHLGYAPVLHADDRAAKLLVDDLGLPYCEVLLTHNDYYLPDQRLWALSKIHTYGLQTKPFLHIDGDVFLFQHLPNTLLQADVIAQNMEEATSFYTTAQATYMQHFSYYPPEVKADFFSGAPIKAVNAGILGGNDVSFFREYAETAIEYVKRNEQHLSSVAIDQFNVFFEQHLCYTMAQKRGLSIGLLFEEAFKDNQYGGLANFHEAPNRRNYLHLLGHFKRDAFACNEMATHFRAIYPEHYYRIMDCCRRNGVDWKRNLFAIEQSAKSEHQFFSLCQDSISLYQNTNGDATNTKEVALNEWWEHKYRFISEWLTDSSVLNVDATNMLADLALHKQQVAVHFNSIEAIDEKWLLGRDLESVQWWRQIFEGETTQVVIKLVPHTLVVRSAYNWGAHFYAMHSEGRPFYEAIEWEQGEYFTLLVPAAGDIGMSMYDLEDIEWHIIQKLTEGPISVERLMSSLSILVDEDVIQNHWDAFAQMMQAYLEQLILKKAICPIH